MTGRYVEGVGGSSRVYSARLKEFSIGPARSTRRTELLVIDEANLTPAFDGIAGSPFLLQMDLEVDLYNKQVRMFKPLNCNDDSALDYWKEETVVLPFAYSRDPSPNPHFKVVVNGKELDATIDTGAHHTVMMLDAAERLGIDIRNAEVKRSGDEVGVGSARAPQWTATFKTVQLGGETINNAEIGIIDSQGATPADLLLGQDFLRTHRVLFAMSQKKMYFAYLGGQPFSRSQGVPDWVRAEADAGNGTRSMRWPRHTAMAAAYRATRRWPGPGWTRPRPAASRTPTWRWAASWSPAAKPPMPSRSCAPPWSGCRRSASARCGCTSRACAMAKPISRKPNCRPS
jgi:hypothetical protein